MIPKRGASEWFIFHDDLVDELEEHFNAGGTADALDGVKCRQSAMFHCINECAEACFPLMLDNNAKMVDNDWGLIFFVDRSWHLQELLFRKYCLPRHVVEKYWSKIPGTDCGIVLATYHCKKAVVTCLCIAQASYQPMSDMWGDYCSECVEI